MKKKTYIVIGSVCLLAALVTGIVLLSGNKQGPGSTDGIRTEKPAGKNGNDKESEISEAAADGTGGTEGKTGGAYNADSGKTEKER